MASTTPKYGIQHTTVAVSNAFESRQISIQTFNSKNIHLQTTLTADSTFFFPPTKILCYHGKVSCNPYDMITKYECHFKLGNKEKTQRFEIIF